MQIEDISFEEFIENFDNYFKNFILRLRDYEKDYNSNSDKESLAYYNGIKAFVVKKNITNKQIVEVIKKAGGKLLTNIELFDLYEGEKINHDEKSVAYNLKFEDMNKTLTEEEVMATFNKIISEVEAKLDAKLRNK